MARIPHAIPYQGSKRLLAPTILRHVPASLGRFYEPFCGSGAMSLAVAASRDAHIHLNDSFDPLARLWIRIIDSPEHVAEAYERLWHAQTADPRAHYASVRDEFNRAKDPDKLLYLLARCVKNAVRFNRAGEFNQSPDHRRRGTRPDTMRKSLHEVASLFRGRAHVTSADYASVVETATTDDLVYLDPPYEGTSGARDQRYHELLDRDRFIATLERLLSRGVPLIVSFDGRSGDKRYGTELPRALGLIKLEIAAGRSSQATLNGGTAETVESLYLSPSLVRS
jgi:DNA adenine methylase